MSDLTLSSADELDLLAAEYAMGVLDATAMRNAERRARGDASFSTAVAVWQERLSPMIAAIEPVTPPAGLWKEIDDDLARITRMQPAQPVRGGGRNVSAFWQWLGLGSLGIAAASLAALFVAVQPVPLAPPMTASLAANGGVPLYTAVVYPGATGATLIPVTAGAALGQSHELWIIPPGASPRSLGVIKSAGPVRIEIAPELLANGGVLAISLEPIGGSPTGQPTGPVVATGELHEV